MIVLMWWWDEDTKKPDLDWPGCCVGLGAALSSMLRLTAQNVVWV